MNAPHDPLLLLRDIERRSMERARGLPLREEQRAEWRGVGFHLLGQKLVASMDEVHEILSYPSVARVPGTHPWVRGIANVRGNLLPIMDLQGFLKHGSLTPLEDSTRVLVITEGELSVGLVVPEVLGMQHFHEEDQTGEWPAMEKALLPFIQSVYQRDGEYWSVFSMRKLASTPMFYRVAV
jgi:twitching motility protein PilI